MQIFHHSNQTSTLSSACHKYDMRPQRTHQRGCWLHQITRHIQLTPTHRQRNGWIHAGDIQADSRLCVHVHWVWVGGFFGGGGGVVFFWHYTWATYKDNSSVKRTVRGLCTWPQCITRAISCSYFVKWKLQFSCVPTTTSSILWLIQQLHNVTVLVLGRAAICCSQLSSREFQIAQT